MRKIFSILSIITICSALTTASFAAANDVEYLYIQSAPSAELKPVKESSGAYSLTLKNVTSGMTCFSERPQRIASSTNVKKFIAAWTHPSASDKNSFIVDAPNADLNGTDATTQKEINIPVVLSNPQYNDKDKTLTYTVDALKGGQKLSAMQLDRVTLFIDYCMTCPR